jgi:hypothetical protein
MDLLGGGSPKTAEPKAAPVKLELPNMTLTLPESLVREFVSKAPAGTVAPPGAPTPGGKVPA